MRIYTWMCTGIIRSQRSKTWIWTWSFRWSGAASVGVGCQIGVFGKSGNPLNAGSSLRASLVSREIPLFTAPQRLSFYSTDPASAALSCLSSAPLLLLSILPGVLNSQPCSSPPFIASTLPTHSSFPFPLWTNKTAA